MHLSVISSTKSSSINELSDQHSLPYFSLDERGSSSHAVNVPKNVHHSLTENTKIADFLETNKTELWFNLCFQTNGYFKYIDGWQMKFTHWGDDEPRQDQPCVYIDVDGKWKTASCNQTFNSVCMTSTGTINHSLFFM